MERHCCHGPDHGVAVRHGAADGGDGVNAVLIGALVVAVWLAVKETCARVELEEQLYHLKRAEMLRHPALKDRYPERWESVLKGQ